MPSTALPPRKAGSKRPASDRIRESLVYTGLPWRGPRSSAQPNQTDSEGLYGFGSVSRQLGIVGEREYHLHALGPVCTGLGASEQLQAPANLLKTRVSLHGACRPGDPVRTAATSIILARRGSSSRWNTSSDSETLVMVRSSHVLSTVSVRGTRPFGRLSPQSAASRGRNQAARELQVLNRFDFGAIPPPVEGGPSVAETCPTISYSLWVACPRRRSRRGRVMRKTHAQRDASRRESMPPWGPNSLCGSTWAKA